MQYNGYNWLCQAIFIATQNYGLLRMTIAEAFRRVRESMGVSQKVFGDLMGISQAYVSQIENGARVNISGSAIDAIANFNNPSYNSPSPESIAELRRAVGQAAEVRFVASTHTSDVVVPMLTQDIHAGDPLPVVADDAESFNVTKHYRDTLVIRVVGDSMVDLGIVDGDKLVVRRQPRFRNGDVVLALSDGEYILKQAYHEGESIRFVPANPKYQPFTRKASDVEVIGVVIEVIRKVGRR